MKRKMSLEDELDVTRTSVAELTVIPFQDWLGLGSEARMNIPSTLGCNWKWRAAPDSITPELAVRLHHVTGLYRRLPR